MSILHTSFKAFSLTACLGHGKQRHGLRPAAVESLWACYLKRSSIPPHNFGTWRIAVGNWNQSLNTPLRYRLLHGSEPQLDTLQRGDLDILLLTHASCALLQEFQLYFTCER